MQDVFKSLSTAIKTHDNIILMGHKNIDLDALGSLLCLYEIATSFKKETCIIINQTNNNSVKKALSKIDNVRFEYNDLEEKKNSLLIIVDTNKSKLLENETLLNKVTNVIVLDHHIKDADYIKNTLFSYVNSNLSSVAELMLSFSRYLNKDISKVTATIMLAGIEIDTNNFMIKTTEKTYESAALLLKLGADNLLKAELMKESKEEYMKRQNLIENAFMLNHNTALCLFDDKIYQKEDLAIVASELLQFDDVKIGISIGKLKENKIGISAKSLGNSNVEMIMKQLGGGGHMNNAAAEIENTTIEEIKDKLSQLIK